MKEIQIPFLNRITLKDRAFLARQLATMLESGFAIDKALQIFIEQTKNKRFKVVLGSILSDVEAGSSLSEAMKKHMDVFDPVFISIIVSGEAVGKLAEVLKELATNLETQNTFTSQVKSALYYPMFVLVVMGIIVFIMITRVIPPLRDIFDEFNTTLPWTTRTLLGLSTFVTNYWWAILMFFILVGIVIYFYLRTTSGKYLYARIQIKLPYDIGRNVYMTRFAQTLSMLLHSGTPIIKSLNITADVMNNVIYKDSLNFAADQMERGIPLSVPLSKDSNFDPMVSQMIRVGEETGKMDQVLDKISIHFAEESNSKLKNINSLLEPMLIVIVGLGVAFIVFSIIMPIYQLVQLQQY